MLEALADIDGPATVRIISTLVGVPGPELAASLKELLSKGFITKTDDRFFFAHAAIRDAVRAKLESRQKPTTVGTLYVTIDSSLMAKEDFVELLEVLNAIYVNLGGDELVIREDEIGRFAHAGVLV